MSLFWSFCFGKWMFSGRRNSVSVKGGFLQVESRVLRACLLSRVCAYPVKKQEKMSSDNATGVALGTPVGNLEVRRTRAWGSSKRISLASLS